MSTQASEISLEKIITLCSEDLKRIDERIKKCFISDAEQLSQVASYLHLLGGKRIRPLLCLLTNRLFTKTQIASNELIDVSSGIELIHMATLLHDDIIDNSSMRRGQPSALVKFGSTASLLGGDFLLVRAFGICSSLDSFIIQETENACIELTEGEILEQPLNVSTANTLQNTGQKPESQNLESYLKVVSKKTASLFKLSTVVATHLANQSHAVIEVAARLGTNLGITFQAVDDIIDILASEDLLGKPKGADLRQKCPSLINLLWLKEMPEEANLYFGKENITEEDYQKAFQQITSNKIILDSARSFAKDYFAKTEKCLEELSALTEVNIEYSNYIKYILTLTFNRSL